LFQRPIEFFYQGEKVKSSVIVEKKGKARTTKSRKIVGTVAVDEGSTTTPPAPEVSLDDLLPNIKESLLFQKSQILNRTNEFKRSQLESVQLSDEAEVASNDLSNNLSIHLHERSMKALLEIDKSLNKIAQGTYGECDGCGDHIQPKRLQARPLAPLCIACMEEREEEIRIKHQ
jgi:DnaK suppressor protein